jgi:hypothetical protein
LQADNVVRIVKALMAYRTELEIFMTNRLPFRFKRLLGNRAPSCRAGTPPRP